MNRCPLCKLQMPTVGRLTAACDDAGQNFVFPVCNRCAGRLERLPMRLQHRQLMIAVRNLATDPAVYGVRFFDDADAALIYCRLESERLAGQLPLTAL